MDAINDIYYLLLYFYSYVIRLYFTIYIHHILLINKWSILLFQQKVLKLLNLFEND